MSALEQSQEGPERAREPYRHAQPERQAPELEQRRLVLYRRALEASLQEPPVVALDAQAPVEVPPEQGHVLRVAWEQVAQHIHRRRQ